MFEKKDSGKPHIQENGFRNWYSGKTVFGKVNSGQCPGIFESRSLFSFPFFFCLNLFQSTFFLLKKVSCTPIRKFYLNLY